MARIPETLSQARIHLRRATDALNRRAEQPGNVGAMATRLTEAIEQFLLLAQRLDRELGHAGPGPKEDVTQKGNDGLRLLMELGARVVQAGSDRARQELAAVTLSTADWITRHRGEIRTLEPVVDALADTANRLRVPGQLEELAVFMGRVTEAVAPYLRLDHARAGARHPWRLLLINRGIVATRSHNVALMEQVFDELVERLPTEAPRFFAEGMEQMDALDYPATVRCVVERYFERWSRPRMH